MSAIDEVIARARQPGGFSERKRFTVARQRAIQKMRRFALSNPYYYVLELIQAAVANGASYVDLDIEGGSFVMSYVGGGFGGDGLGQLFDFLFASKESLELADLRQLALGVNALMLAEPREVTIESGDGTLAGTTRISVDGRSSTVDVGTPEEPLKGTYVRAVRMDHSKLGGRSGPLLKELAVIEERCLTAPVPIIVNSSPVFGLSSERVPRLGGFERTLAFDEGDLYGAIGVSSDATPAAFRLLTWGVWIESIAHDLLPGTPMGGVVVFDRLHKTADHAAIVRDERLEELWARLRPHARRLASGRTGGAAAFDIRAVDGRSLSTADIRRLLGEHELVVALRRPAAVSREAWLGWAEAYSEAFAAPVLETGRDDASVLRLLGGPATRVIDATPGDHEELDFYRTPEAEPPPRPWLTGAVALDPIPLRDLADLVAREVAAPETPAGRLSRDIVSQRLGASGEARATVFAPEAPAGDGSLRVEVLTARRLAWSGDIRGAYPGLLLRVDLGEVRRGALLAEPGSGVGRPLATLVARAVAGAARGRLEEATKRVLDAVEPGRSLVGTAGARIALAALARGAIKRLRRGPSGGLEVRLGLHDPAVPDALLEARLLRSLDGRELSFRDLEALMAETSGLVYGALRDIPADLEGLDRSRILDLDPPSERLLVTILGEGSYVRVDGRDLLATHNGSRVRDVALGLRAYPDFPLLVEGRDASARPEAERRATENALVGALVEAFLGGRSAETRRQAARHLLWYLVRAEALGKAPDRVRGLPLFLGASGEPLCWEELEAEARSEAGVPMHDGWATDPAELGALLRGGPARRSYRPGDGLAMSPFVFHALAAAGLRVRPVYDFDLTGSEAAANPATPDVPFLVSAEVSDALATGVVGVPAEETGETAVALVDPASRRVGALLGPARELGIVGRLRVRSREASEAELERLARRAGLEVLEALMGRLPSLPEGSPVWCRAVRTLFHFAGLHVRLTADPGDGLSLDVLDPVAERILDLPIFPIEAAASVSGRHVLESFARAGGAGPALALSPSAPPLLREVVSTLLDERRVVRLPSKPAEPRAPLAALPSAVDDATLSAWLTRAIEALGPDPFLRGAGLRVVVVPPGGPREIDVGLAAPPLAKRQLHALVAGGPGRTFLVLNGRHWLVERLRSPRTASPEAVAWLLLSCYASLNDALAAVTNEDERAFQARVLELLARGELRLAGPA